MANIKTVYNVQSDGPFDQKAHVADYTDITSNTDYTYPGMIRTVSDKKSAYILTGETYGQVEADWSKIATEDYVDATYAKKSEIPTEVSKLANDAGYLKSIPDEYIKEGDLNAKKYATESFVTDEIAKAKLSGENVDLSEYAKKSDIPTVPSSVSAFENDSGYLTDIPEEYVTEQALNDYLQTAIINEFAEKDTLSDYRISDAYTKQEVNTLVNTTIAEKLEGLASESAASVQANLNTYQTTTDGRLATLETPVIFDLSSLDLSGELGAGESNIRFEIPVLSPDLEEVLTTYYNTWGFKDDNITTSKYIVKWEQGYYEATVYCKAGQVSLLFTSFLNLCTYYVEFIWKEKEEELGPLWYYRVRNSVANAASYIDFRDIDLEAKTERQAPMHVCAWLNSFYNKLCATNYALVMLPGLGYTSYSLELVYGERITITANISSTRLARITFVRGDYLNPNETSLTFWNYTSSIINLITEAELDSKYQELLDRITALESSTEVS